MCALQRVLMLTYDKDSQRISFRHYSIRAAPSGVSKSVKALLARDQLPDMHDYADVSEFLTKSGYGSVRVHSRLITSLSHCNWQPSLRTRCALRSRSHRDFLAFSSPGFLGFYKCFR